MEIFAHLCLCLVAFVVHCPTANQNSLTRHPTLTLAVYTVFVYGLLWLYQYANEQHFHEPDQSENLAQ